jgi:hypothetical protein
MTTVAYLALAVAAISMTTAKGAIFRPARLWIHDHNEWLGELVMCPYCLSHWLAFGAVAAYQPRLVHSGFALLDYALTAFVLVTIAAAGCAVIWGSMVFIAMIPKRKEEK